MPTIIDAIDPAMIESARVLFREYQQALGIDLCFQNFETELRDLPGEYAPPRGRLLLAMDGNITAGCIAMRPLSEDICEMKRLYVAPAGRGAGLGRKLALVIIEAARAAGYREMRLDTLASMAEAQALYRSLGFVEIAPYYETPVDGTVFMSMAL